MSGIDLRTNLELGEIRVQRGPPELKGQWVHGGLGGPRIMEEREGPVEKKF